MSKTPAFTLTNDTITVIWEGKTYTVRKDAANFKLLRQALMSEDWEAVPNRLTPTKGIQDWAKGKFQVAYGVLTYDGQPIPSQLNQRISSMAAAGEDPTPLFKFWEKLQKNPSMRSVEQLWPFLMHKGIPLTKDGNFLAYKGVRSDFKDAHSNTYDNSPGNIHEMPRNKISDDPKEACHEGFHVGALEYARSFSQRVVVCEVDPADVVCIPYDHSHQKMRVCKYKVVGNHNGSHLPSTSFEEPVDDDTEFEGDDADDSTESLSLPTDSTEDLRGVAEGTKPAPKGTVRGVQKKYAKIHAMAPAELLDQSLEKLRKYASQGLKIVGAYRIPGGKLALVDLILKTRE